MKTNAFLYKWTQLTTGKWYIGSRTRKGCHPNDGYLCSSKTVKPLIVSHPEEWKRDILVVGNPIYIREIETTYLVKFDAAKDTNSFNLSNSHGKYSFTGQTHSEKTKLAISLGNKGIKRPGSGNRTSNRGSSENRGNKKCHKGKNNPCYGRTGKLNPMFNKKHPPEMKKVLSDIKMGGKNPNSKRVLTPFGHYDTLKEAALAYKVSSNTIKYWITTSRLGFSFINLEKNKEEQRNDR